ncbi:hypothetical protein ANN_27076 [Periplaneta americana]|uniref:Uncharacterized protein n=1 Tax=Periplaneta americana TaxID=6978 RepID=A0ABQ8RX64_PERAM|nr:hypothetical protein ANN_27076 [Periplaneta americana]
MAGLCEGGNEPSGSLKAISQFPERCFTAIALPSSNLDDGRIVFAVDKAKVVRVSRFFFATPPTMSTIPSSLSSTSRKIGHHVCFHGIESIVCNGAPEGAERNATSSQRSSKVNPSAAILITVGTTMLVIGPTLLLARLIDSRRHDRHSVKFSKTGPVSTPVWPKSRRAGAAIVRKTLMMTLHRC